MNTDFDISQIEKRLSPRDRSLLRKFLKTLLQKEEYARLKKEIEERRREVEGERLSNS